MAKKTKQVETTESATPAPPAINKFAEECRAHAEELVKRIKTHESSWDPAFRYSLARHEWSKWLAAGRDETMALHVELKINEALGYTYGSEFEPLEYGWWVDESEQRRVELIDQQEATCNEIELAKDCLEAANERKKSAQAAIDEGNSRLRFLARELKKPFVPPLPLAPARQRELPLGDGEEWRVVPLADVLTGKDATMKAVALEKLGAVTLGQYAEMAEKWGRGDKPKKLTRKQWDRIEAIVQDWHAQRAEEAAAEDAEDASDDAELEEAASS